MADDVVQVEENPFDLTSQLVDDGGYLVGYIAIVKTLTEDGRVQVQFISHEMDNKFEAVGILQTQLDYLRAMCTSMLFQAEDDEDEEDE